jgi:O-methyltransferase involved in polyketide biosynthesis
MHDKQVATPDNTAVRTALWRALHVEIDSQSHVFEDTVGLKLVAPDDEWRSRSDMNSFTQPFPASILVRARFVKPMEK